MRNQTGLTPHQIQRCVEIWEFLGGNELCPLITLESSQHGSKTRFREPQNKVYLGADVEPGVGTNARDRMSSLACLAHELAHALRYKKEYKRPATPPHNYIDEAEASIEASFTEALSLDDRKTLIEDARDQLAQWLRETATGHHES